MEDREGGLQPICVCDAIKGRFNSERIIDYKHKVQQKRTKEIEQQKQKQTN